MKIVKGKKVNLLQPDEVPPILDAYEKILIDVGTGDGRFVYRTAKENPGTLCIGMDAVAEKMREMSHKAGRKPARGGLANTLYVLSAIEDPPVELNGVADRVHVNYPWGSLLAAFVLPQEEVLGKIVAFGRPGASFSILLNYSVFEDEAYMERLGLPSFDQESVTERLEPALQEHGVQILRSELMVGEAPHNSTWERRLTAGSNRKTLIIEAVLGAGSN